MMMREGGPSALDGQRAVGECSVLPCRARSCWSAQPTLFAKTKRGARRSTFFFLNLNLSWRVALQ